MTDNTDRCDDPILLIREAVRKAIVNYIPSVAQKRFVDCVVDNLPDFFRQPLRADHEEKGTQADNAG